MKKLLISILITAFFTTNNYASLWDKEDMRKRNLEPTISLYCPNSQSGIVLFDHLKKNEKEAHILETSIRKNELIIRSFDNKSIRYKGNYVDFGIFRINRETLKVKIKSNMSYVYNRTIECKPVSKPSDIITYLEKDLTK